jgi:putative oxidoreductase
MPDETLTQALFRALLVLRITLGLFLLQRGVEKFVVPQNTVAIWGYFYGLNVPQALAYLFGAALALHAVSVLVSWRQMLDPWGDPANHLFIAGFSVLAP